jgi:uncharacterized membrane protein SpoIIM required for sporulation
VSQAGFEQRHRGDWLALEAMLANTARPSPNAETDLRDLPATYRRVCQHLALARHRRYSSDLVDRLNALALGGHDLLYREGTQARIDWIETLLLTFPRVLRASWGPLAWATLAFLGPFAALYLGARLDPDFVYMLLDPESVYELEAMYDPESERFLRERGSGSDLMMFGYYIRNNIGISFRTFAGGILGGAGSLFFLVFNGAYFGAVAAHLDNVGSSEPFWSFVIGHGAFELTAIVISGAAGLRIGLALLSPGQRTRTTALVAEARASLPLIYGFTAMLLIAAFVEAFWSSTSGVPAATKYAVGGVLWATVLLYLALAGRRHGS